PDHTLNQSVLFRWVRHPNYFLNILPELVGLALMMGAWLVLVLGLPLYLLVLRTRIVQEEQVMRQHFPGYTTRPLPPRVQDTTLAHPSAGGRAGRGGVRRPASVDARDARAPTVPCSCRRCHACTSRGEADHA